MTTLRESTQAPAKAPARPWGLPQYLALAALPVLLLETWTIVTWLADGPSMVTEYRTPQSPNWWAAQVYQGLAVVVAIAVSTYVVRGCLREKKVWTFDLMFCVAGATMIWAVSATNVIMPTFLESSNFISVYDMCSHNPLVVNPDCSRIPNALPFWLLFSAFGPLAGALTARAVLVAARRRWPAISKARQFLVLGAFGAVAALVLEGPAVTFGLWSYTAGPTSVPFGHVGRYTAVALLETALFFVTLSALWVFRNDRGETLVQRGLTSMRPRARGAITFLALYSVFQFAAWIPGSVPVMVYGFYESEWPELPGYLLNDMCDAPGVTGTRYGPCPGSPDFLMPGRGSLPGDAP